MFRRLWSHGAGGLKDRERSSTYIQNHRVLLTCYHGNCSVVTQSFCQHRLGLREANGCFQEWQHAGVTRTDEDGDTTVGVDLETADS